MDLSRPAPESSKDWHYLSARSGPSIYVLFCEATDLLKFGMSYTSAYHRWKSICTGPVEVDLWAIVPLGDFGSLKPELRGESLAAVERHIHDDCSDSRVRGEWFSLTEKVKDWALLCSILSVLNWEELCEDAEDAEDAKISRQKNPTLPGVSSEQNNKEKS